MSDTTKTLIATTVAIVGMTRDEIQTVLLDILASNPSIVQKAMNIAPANTFFKVVCDGKQTNKIGLIKEFRTINGAGLADSKMWSEGKTYNGLEAGVFARDLTREQADQLASEINQRAKFGGSHNGFQFAATDIRAKVVKMSDPTDYRANWEVQD
jgi:ribosomal protein L7/L12